MIMIRSTHLIEHQQCPRCKENGHDNSQDNLGVYPDHVYCFKCGYYKKNSAYHTQPLLKKETRVIYENHKNIVKGLCLPSDFVLHLPPIGKSWLDKYHLTSRELRDNRIGWSENGITFSDNVKYAPCLVLPVFDKEDKLLLYQLRYFGKDGSLPKYYTKGNPNNVLHILGGITGPITIVEDLISAIKVARYGRSMPLFGSNLSLSMAYRLARYTDSLVLWLDYNKTKDAHKLRNRYAPLFSSIAVRTSFKDPKEYDFDE